MQPSARHRDTEVIYTVGVARPAAARYEDFDRSERRSIASSSSSSSSSSPEAAPAPAPSKAAVPFEAQDATSWESSELRSVHQPGSPSSSSARRGDSADCTTTSASSTSASLRASVSRLSRRSLPSRNPYCRPSSSSSVPLLLAPRDEDARGVGVGVRDGEPSRGTAVATKSCTRVVRPLSAASDSSASFKPASISRAKGVRVTCSSSLPSRRMRAAPMRAICVMEARNWRRRRQALSQQQAARWLACARGPCPTCVASMTSATRKMTSGVRAMAAVTVARAPCTTMNKKSIQGMCRCTATTPSASTTVTAAAVMKSRDSDTTGFISARANQQTAIALTDHRVPPLPVAVATTCDPGRRDATGGPRTCVVSEGIRDVVPGGADDEARRQQQSEVGDVEGDQQQEAALSRQIQSRVVGPADAIQQLRRLQFFRRRHIFPLLCLVLLLCRCSLGCVAHAEGQRAARACQRRREPPTPPPLVGGMLTCVSSLTVQALVFLARLDGYAEGPVRGLDQERLEDSLLLGGFGGHGRSNPRRA
eukprot:scaffold1882_cov384-Prasinococcus_capsulatus_cf.AAC.2